MRRVYTYECSHGRGATRDPENAEQAPFDPILIRAARDETLLTQH